jgi:hypothetical protein
MIRKSIFYVAGVLVLVSFSACKERDKSLDNIPRPQTPQPKAKAVTVDGKKFTCMSRRTMPSDGGPVYVLDFHGGKFDRSQTDVDESGPMPKEVEKKSNGTYTESDTTVTLSTGETYYKEGSMIFPDLASYKFYLADPQIIGKIEAALAKYNAENKETSGLPEAIDFCRY